MVITVPCFFCLHPPPRQKKREKKTTAELNRKITILCPKKITPDFCAFVDLKCEDLVTMSCFCTCISNTVLSKRYLCQKCLFKGTKTLEVILFNFVYFNNYAFLRGRKEMKWQSVRQVYDAILYHILLLLKSTNKGINFTHFFSKGKWSFSSKNSYNSVFYYYLFNQKRL